MSLIKDEEDVVRDTVGHMLEQVDRVYVADNGSTDGTRDILDSLADRYELTIVDDPDPAHYQSRKLSSLAAMAYDEGAEWIIPFDADEVWVARGHARIAGALEAIDPDISVCAADLYDRVATARDDLSLPPIQRMKWRRPYQLPLPKVAFRMCEGAVIHDGNHGVTLPGKNVPLRLGGLLLVHHFPYRSPDHFIRKVRKGATALRAATDLPEGVGGHWLNYDQFSDEQLRDLFFTWYFRTTPEQSKVIEGQEEPPLVRDPLPAWQPTS